MIQENFSLEESQLQFLDECRSYGLKDKSAVVRMALDLLRREFAQQRLQESADLYSEICAEDEETQELTAAALPEWPK